MPKKPLSLKPLKPRLFIASAGEGQEIANKLQVALGQAVEATVWHQGVFESGDFTLERLTTILATFDFAAFIFTPDDVLNIRKTKWKVVRDNVVFELGLFIGGLGLNRCFVIVPEDSPKLRLPTDLLGMTVLRYETSRQDGNLVAALGSASEAIRDRVRERGRRIPSSDAAAKLLLDDFKAYLAASSVEQPAPTIVSDQKLPIAGIPAQTISWPEKENGKGHKRKTAES